MITDNDLAHAISQAAAGYDRGIISAGILIRDVRKAMKFYDAQSSEQASVVRADFSA